MPVGADNADDYDEGADDEADGGLMIKRSAPMTRLMVADDHEVGVDDKADA